MKMEFPPQCSFYYVLIGDYGRNVLFALFRKPVEETRATSYAP